MVKTIKINGPSKSFIIANDRPIKFIAGPCVIEGMDFALRTAEKLKNIFEKANVDFIYKSSFDKANRSSVKSYRGVGLDEGLRILEKVRKEVDVPVITDVHTKEQADPVSNVVDMMQTPAFLCRQTDFIQKVASTGIPINLKKGQFLSPWDMQYVLNKALDAGNDQIALCERGTSFGYGNLVVDMRGLSVMYQTGYPVIFDATHSVQLPGSQGGSTGGQREFISTLASAAVAIGISGLFIEAHPDPDNAPCDGPNMLPFTKLPKFLDRIKRIDDVSKSLT